MLFFYLALLDNAEDETLFTKLYHRYREAMYNTANAVLDNHHDAEDAVHNTFMRIARKWKTLNLSDTGKAGSLFRSMCRFQALNLLERNNRRAAEPLWEGSALALDDYEAIEANYDAGLLLECLPVLYRDVVRLKAAYDYNDKEIAELLLLSEDAVRKRLQRARDMMREKMGDVVLL